MRTWALGWIVLTAGCSVAPTTDLGWDPGTPEEATDAPKDLLEAEGPEDVAPAESRETGEVEACPGGIRPWQCLVPGDCPPGSSCSGPASCLTESCPGGCPDIGGKGPGVPGVCLWAPTATLCSATQRCPAGTGCLPAGVPDLGVCRALPPVSGACWSDLDCPTTMGCIGEIRCPVTRWTTCVDHPGLCLPRPGPPACLEDEDCPETEWCEGAILCALGDPACADRPGTCRSGPAPGCTGNADCSGGSEGPVCIAVASGGTGYCSPGAGLREGECWQDGESWCGEEAPACPGAAPCPPGRRCRAAGMHGGICAAFPPPGEEGVRIDVLRKDDPNTVLIIRNEGPQAIFIPTCDTLLMETQKDGAWPQDGSFTGTAQDVLCGGQGVPSALRIPSGGARVLQGLEVYLPLPAWKRMVLQFRMGCDGRDPEGGVCTEKERVAYSEAFQ